MEGPWKAATAEGLPSLNIFDDNTNNDNSSSDNLFKTPF